MHDGVSFRVGILANEIEHVWTVSEVVLGLSALSMFGAHVAIPRIYWTTLLLHGQGMRSSHIGADTCPP